jgi:hypothetical protein
MARNRMQFQKGLSLAEFHERYGTEEKCQAALIAMRWPDGFLCPCCGSIRNSWSPARRHFQCSDFRLQTSAKHDLPQIEDAADQVVFGDAPHHLSQE